MSMAVLLENLYREMNHTDMKLVAGAGGMDRAIRWMHMVEGLEISSFLQGEEIAFITGIGLKNTKTETLTGLLHSIYDHGGSAVVINVGMYIDTIPEEALAFCNDVALPLFEVPWSVHMAEIMHVFAQKITEDERCSIELKSALKYALYTPLSTEAYVPVFEQHGFHGNGEYRLVTVQYEPSTEMLEQEKTAVLRKMSLQCEAVLHQHHACCVFILDGKLVQLVHDCPADSIKTALEAARTRMETVVPDGHVYISVSMTMRGLAQLHACYDQVGKMCRLQKRCQKNMAVYDELGAYKILLDAGHAAVLTAYYRDVLGPLEEYDQLHDSQLMEVVKVYLETNGSIHQTADILYIHRNTVTYKIHKAEELLGCDVSLLSTRFTLRLALMIKNLT
jgi:hypothetical protein